MIHLQWGRAIAGSLVGFVFGIIFGAVFVVNRGMAAYRAELAKAGIPGPTGAVGVDIRVFLHSPLFWSIVVICTLILGFLAGRIGYRTL
jgi:uncharacterized membrane protein